MSDTSGSQTEQKEQIKWMNNPTWINTILSDSHKENSALNDSPTGYNGFCVSKNISIAKNIKNFTVKIEHVLIRFTQHVRQSNVFAWHSISAFPEQAKNVKEEVDDIEIEIDGGMDILLRRHFMHNHVCIKDDEHGEQYGSGSCNASFEQLTLNEYLIEAQNTTINYTISLANY